MNYIFVLIFAFIWQCKSIQHTSDNNSFTIEDDGSFYKVVNVGSSSAIGIVLSDNVVLSLALAIDVERELVSVDGMTPKSIVVQRDVDKNNTINLKNTSNFAVLIFEDGSFKPKISKIGESEKYLAFINKKTNKIQFDALKKHRLLNDQKYINKLLIDKIPENVGSEIILTNNYASMLGVSMIAGLVDENEPSKGAEILFITFGDADSDKLLQKKAKEIGARFEYFTPELVD